MSPFNSAEFKDCLETMWELGSTLTARQISRLFRSGELRSIIREIESIRAAYLAIKAEYEDLPYQIATQDEYLHELILEAEDLRETQRVRERVLLAVENQLAAEVAACARWVKGLTTDDRARQACDIARDMEEITIPALYERIEDGEVELAALDASVRHNTDQLRIMQERYEHVTELYDEYRERLADLGI